MNSNQHRRYHRAQGRELDQALAQIMAAPRTGIPERIPLGNLDRFITVGVQRHGSGFEGFAHGVAEGKIDSDGITDAGRLYRHCYVGTFSSEVQVLDFLLGELGIVEQFETAKSAADEMLRELLVIDEDRAWEILGQHYYVTDDEDGIHAYRRRPRQLASE